MRLPALLFFALLSLTYSACSDDKVVGRVTDTATVPPSAAVLSPTPTPSGIFSIGDTVESTKGFHFTVFTYGPVTSGNSFSKPEPGNEFVAAEVQECNSASATDTYSANPFHFELQMPDNTRQEADVGIRKPSLNSTTLPAGDCARGWVTFQVPVGVAPRYVVFAPSFGGIVIKWQAP